jgi:hypothetical protein
MSGMDLENKPVVTTARTPCFCLPREGDRVTSSLCTRPLLAVPHLIVRQKHMNNKATILLGAALFCLLSSCASSTDVAVVRAPSGYCCTVSAHRIGDRMIDPISQKPFTITRLYSSQSAAENDRYGKLSPSEIEKENRFQEKYLSNLGVTIENSSNNSEREKSGFAKFLGGTLEGAVGAVGVLAETQLAQNGYSGGSSYMTTAASPQQSTSQASVGTSPGSQSQQETIALGPMSLGAASGPISVAFNASRYTTGNGAIHSVYAQKKRNWTNAQGYVSGYNAQGVLHTSNFEVLFASQGPHSKQVVLSGANDFSRGLKEVKITKYW